MIEGISAVTLGTHEMPRAVRFYRALGFEVLHGGEESSFTSFRAGTSYLNLIAQPAERRWSWWGRIFAGDFRLMPAGPRVQRQTRMREKARISGSFSRLVGSRAERRNAWLATQCRSHGSSSRFRSEKPLRCSTFPSNSLSKLTGKIFQGSGNFYAITGYFPELSTSRC